MRKSIPTLACVLALATAVGAQIRPLSGSDPLGDPRPRLPAGMGECVAGVCVDLDGDGRLDLVRATSERLHVLLQDASGVFAEHAAQNPALLVSAAGIHAIASGDFDADGDADLAVGLLRAADFLLLNDGTGRMTRAAVGSLPTNPFVATLGLVAVNVDRRGGDDLLVLPANGPPQLWLATLGAQFIDATGLLPQALSQPREMAAAGDFDRDGAPDLVLAGTALAPTAVLFNSGTGDFTQLALPAANGPRVRGLAIADLDGDRVPELVLVGDSAAASAPYVARVSRLGVVRIAAAPGGFALPGWRAIAIADFDGDAVADLVALGTDGAGWLAPGLGDGTFPAGREILVPGGRREVCAGDLDLDGDADLVVFGSTLADAILLGAPPNAPVSTEDATHPSGGALAGAHVAIVDASGEGDPDLVLCSPSGRFWLWRNDGGARFATDPLTPPTQTGLGAIVALLGGRLAGGGVARDVFVVGQPSGMHPTGVRLLGGQGSSGWVDRSSMMGTNHSGRVFTAAALATLGAARAASAPSDLLLGDAAGHVSVHRNDGVTITAVPRAVPLTHPGSIHAILTGDLDGDGAHDLVVLPANGPPEVHLATPPSYVLFTNRPGQFVNPWPAVAGVLEDFDGDGRLDLLLVTPTSPEGMAFYFGTGNGGFVDATLPELGAIVPVVGARVVTVLGPPGAQRAVIGRDARAPLSIGRRAGGPFALIAGVAMHGESAALRFARADLDGDGDEDLVVSRLNAGPAVLLRSDLGLAARGPAQVGKVVRFDVTAPPGQLAIVLFSPQTTRVPFPPLGVLRLAAPATLLGFLTPPTGAAAIELPVPSGLLPGSLPLQLVVLDPVGSTVALANLEIAELSDG